MAACVPGLRPEWVAAVFEPDSKDIDVGAFHAQCLARAREAGAQIRCRSGLATARRANGGWRLTLADGSEIAAAVLVDAAGAWADEVARIAGVRPVGIQPYRRTMLQLRTAPAALGRLLLPILH